MSDGDQHELHPHTPDLEMPEATTKQPPRGPGGADAAPQESDVGEGEHPQGVLLTPDPPFSAQTESARVPDEIQEPEEPEEPDESAGDQPQAAPSESPD